MPSHRAESDAVSWRRNHRACASLSLCACVFFFSAMPSVDSGTSARKSAPRFTEEEKLILVGLVNKYKHILECKKTDVAFINKKTETWTELAKQFNSNHGVTSRDPRQLKGGPFKKCWVNMKQKWKEERAEEKRKVFKTGGGPPPPPMDSVSALVGAVASHMATRIPNAYDSDGATYLAPVTSEPVLQLLRQCAVYSLVGQYNHILPEDDYHPGSPTCVGVDNDTIAPAPPTDPESTEVAPPATAANVTANSEAAPAGSTIPRGRLSLLQKSLSEEADVRFALLREEHALRMRLMEEDHTDKFQKRDEEHKLQMDILKRQKDIKYLKLKRLQEGK
ncbi:myb/SANT-like DNA-binding domain-containing protein 3 [Rhipicephalus sanguineus]|uniref:myb/SANT-like DNA-binding domain-containing protein 3 n=1 Tax=Rhipicephalus sanguineus TaxID=34632 RepID=UPI00189364C6|nr:myb/SANT-like DNA-binding domain-containing protein 3 [Rhipicephalus sanguineus]